MARQSSSIREQRIAQERKLRTVIITIVAILSFGGIIMCGYGHAALSTDLLISGDASIVMSQPFTSEYMQDLTPSECAKAPIHSQKQMKDKRGNGLTGEDFEEQSYWIIKYADGNCWMAQDLKLQLSPSVTLTSTLTATERDWAPVYATLSTVSVAPTVRTADRSYDFGQYVYINPASTASGCGTGKTSLSQCTKHVVDVSGLTPSSDPNFYEKNGVTYNDTEYDAHYLIGTYYQPAAAVAYKSGDSFVALEPSPSNICPAGWVIPTGARSASGTIGDYIDMANMEMAYTGETTGWGTNRPPYYYSYFGIVSGTTKLSYVGGGSSYTVAYRSGTMASTTTPKTYYYAGGSAMPSAAMSETVALVMRCMLRGE